MSTGSRIFLAVSAAVSILMLATLGAAAAAVYRSGTVAVAVEPPDGGGLSISVPAILIHIAVALAPAEMLDEVRDELRPVWPTIRAAARELDRAPDFVLLEIRSGGERVIVEKEARRMLVRIETDGDTVRVSIPIRTVRRIVDRVPAG